MHLYYVREGRKEGTKLSFMFETPSSRMFVPPRARFRFLFLMNNDNVHAKCLT